MDMAAVEPQSSPQFETPTSHLSSEESYKQLLQESIHHLLVQLRGGVSDFSHFHLIFSRLVQTIPSPPVEIIWFYAAVSFHAHKAVISHHAHKAVISHQNPKVRVSAVKDLFQLLVSCSDSCSALDRIGVLAPLVFELYNLVRGLKLQQNSSFDGDTCGDIDCLLERVVSYISICCCGSVYAHDNSQTLSCCFRDLVQVWTFDVCGRDLEYADYFKVLFPAVSSEVHFRLREGCGVGYLAGVVMLESFLLRLCLKLGSHGPEKELVEAVTTMAVDMISGFRSCYFFDILLKMLLEPTISITCLLSYEHEVLLRKVLFNAVMIVDYPFLHSGSEMQPCSNHLENLALTWLFVAENALSFLREHFGESEADAYARGFFISISRSWLMGWLTKKLCIEETKIQRISSSSAALFDWVSGLHCQVSDPDISKLLAKAAHYRSRMKCKHPMQDPGGHKKECDNLWTNGYATLEIDETPRFNFCSEFNDRGRKRKDMSDDATGLKIKVLKYQSCEDSFNRSLPLHNGDGCVMKNEMESSTPDEDMEIMVQ